MGDWPLLYIHNYVISICDWSHGELVDLLSELETAADIVAHQIDILADTTDGGDDGA